MVVLLNVFVETVILVFSGFLDEYNFKRTVLIIIIIIIICYISAFLDTQSALYRGWGAGLLNHHQCAASTWMMPRQPRRQNAHHTPAYWWRGDKVMKPISVWG